MALELERFRRPTSRSRLLRTALFGVVADGLAVAVGVRVPSAMIVMSLVTCETMSSTTQAPKGESSRIWTSSVTCRRASSRSVASFGLR